jgi:nucleoside-diphosphate-sugar epimerase
VTDTAWRSTSRRSTRVRCAGRREGRWHLGQRYRARRLLSDNLHIQLNVIDAAQRHGVRRLLFLGSSCIYPKFAEQPIREDSLLTGLLEPRTTPMRSPRSPGSCRCKRTPAARRLVHLRHADQPLRAG